MVRMMALSSRRMPEGHGFGVLLPVLAGEQGLMEPVGIWIWIPMLFCLMSSQATDCRCDVQERWHFSRIQTLYICFL